ncbi:MAG: FtsX-like permease family protein [Candidatus Thorarchaeota archaeon]|jgi:ABC-type lipoprotein release transport system permease subunit
MFLFARLSARAPEVLATLLIFSLSSGVLGGILFYMDSTAPSVLNDMTADVPIDMEVSFNNPFYNQNSTTVDEIRNVVESQENVITTELVTFVNIYDWYVEDYRYSRKGFLGINSTAFESFPESIELDGGSFAYDDNSCLVEKSLFLTEGLEIGGNYTISVMVEDWSNGNYSEILIEKSFIVVGTFVSNIYMFEPYWNEPEITFLQVITTANTLETLFDLLPHDEWYGIQNRIWVKFDRSAVIQNNAEIMIESLENVKKQIEQETLPYGVIGWDSFKLKDSVYEYAIWSMSVRGVAIAFSIPSIIMGVMLIQYNSKLLSDEKRRDVGTIKTRGSSGIQAFSWVLSSAITTGIIGSIGAVFTGIMAAFLSGSVRELLVFSLDQLTGFTMLLQPAAIIIVFSFSFIVGLIVALPSAVKALLMTPTEAHSVLEGEILAESEEMGSPAIDMLVVGVSGYLLLLMMVTYTMSGLTSMASTFFAATIIPMMALFLFFFTRMLSRSTATIKSKVLSRIQTPSLVVGTRLISRTTKMFKKSEAIGTMFIAMVFIAGVFAALSATTGNTHMKHVFYFETGADIAVEVDPTLSNVTMDLIQNITAVDGVAQVSPMLRVSGYIQYWNAYAYSGGENVNRSISVFGVQPDTWVETAFWLDYFTLYNRPQVSIPKLNESLEDGINIITTFKPVSHYAIDQITNQPIPEYSPFLDLQVFSSDWFNMTDCTIVDIMKNRLEGYPQRTYFPGESDISDFLIMDISLLHNWINSTYVTKFYVDLEPGANYTQAMNSIYSIAPFSFNTIESAHESIDDILDSRATQSIFGAYTLNVLFSLIYLTFGMVIVTTVRVRGLRKQFSVLRALGADAKSMLVASLVDSGTGLLLAGLIGGAIGTTLALLLKDIPLLYMGLATTQLWTRLPVNLIVPWPLLAGVVGTALIVSLIATYVVVSRALKLNIAEEIQYTG